MAPFLTVKEAAKLVGKSPSSIRRIIYPILEKDDHPDRNHIAPSPEQARALRVKGENFPWRISEELLHREIPVEGPKGQPSEKPHTTASGEEAASIVEVLRRELDIKNRQIETQNELLKGLSERLREGNILIGSLQRQLTLGDGASRPHGDVVDAHGDAATPQQGSTPAVPTPAKKESLFQRWFRR